MKTLRYTAYKCCSSISTAFSQSSAMLVTQFLRNGFSDCDLKLSETVDLRVWLGDCQGVTSRAETFLEVTVT